MVKKTLNLSLNYNFSRLHLLKNIYNQNLYLCRNAPSQIEQTKAACNKYINKMCIYIY